MGFATFGRCGESCTGAESRAAPATNQPGPTTASLAAHRHRLLRSFPSGNSRKIRINAPRPGIPIQFCSQAVHRTQPCGEHAEGRGGNDIADGTRSHGTDGCPVQPEEHEACRNDRVAEERDAPRQARRRSRGHR